MVRFEPALNRRAVGMYLVWFFTWVVITGLCLFLTPSAEGHGTHRQLGLPPCSSVLLFGRPCPGCGLTTSFTSTVQMNWDKALGAHPFGPWLYAAFTLSAFLALFGYIKMRHIDLTRKGYWAVGLFVAAYLVYGGIRFAYPGPNYPAGRESAAVARP